MCIRDSGHSSRRGRDPYGDYDDYDDDDDYDDYDDDYEDDYDDDDYDDDRRSFGHYLLGFFKTVFWILLALIIIVVGMNLLHFTGTIDISGLRDTVHGWSPAVSDMLFVAVADDAEGETVAPEDGAADAGAADANTGAETDVTLPDGAQANDANAQSGLAPVAPAA